MSKLIIYIRYTGIVLFSSFIIVLLAILILNNYLFEIYEFKRAAGQIVRIEDKSANSLTVYYKYTVDGEVYFDDASAAKSYFNEIYKGKDINILYNNSFPSINQVEQITSYGGYYIIISVFSILLLVLIFIGNKRLLKSYEMYQRALDKRM